MLIVSRHVLFHCLKEDCFWAPMDSVLDQYVDAHANMGVYLTNSITLAVSGNSMIAFG